MAPLIPEDTLLVPGFVKFPLARLDILQEENLVCGQSFGLEFSIIVPDEFQAFFTAVFFKPFFSSESGIVASVEGWDGRNGIYGNPSESYAYCWVSGYSELFTEDGLSTAFAWVGNSPFSETPDAPEGVLEIIGTSIKIPLGQTAQIPVEFLGPYNAQLIPHEYWSYGGTYLT